MRGVRRRDILSATSLPVLWSMGCRDTSVPTSTDAGIDSGADAMDAISIDACSGPRNLFGTYNFTIDARPAAEQIGLLLGFGYEGIVIEWKGADAYAAFASDPSVVGKQFKIVAVLVELNADVPIDRRLWVEVFEALKGSETCAWVLVTGAKDWQRIANAIDAVAEIGNTMSNTPLVLYPHWRMAIETAEESLEVMRLLKSTSVRTSLHLCHELKAGNGDRLNDVIARVSTSLSLVSVNGAYLIDDDPEGWARNITPLDEGDFDVANEYLRPLQRARYEGPIVLHTFGIRLPPVTHYPRSIEAYRRTAWDSGPSSAGPCPGEATRAASQNQDR